MLLVATFEDNFQQEFFAKIVECVVVIKLMGAFETDAMNGTKAHVVYSGYELIQSSRHEEHLVEILTVQKEENVL